MTGLSAKIVSTSVGIVLTVRCARRKPDIVAEVANRGTLETLVIKVSVHMGTLLSFLFVRLSSPWTSRSVAGGSWFDPRLGEFKKKLQVRMKKSTCSRDISEIIFKTALDPYLMSL